MTNETDNCFKTALDGLPDAPPPGSAFDAEALWGDLDRQLRPRRRFTGGWVAAACGLLTLLAGLGGWVLFSEEKTTGPSEPAGGLATRPVHQRTERPKALPPAKLPEVAKQPNRQTLSPNRAVFPHPKARLEPESVAESAPVVPEVAPVAPTAPEVSPQLTPEPAVALAKPVFSEKKLARSKPRFRVVHANELPSSETISIKQPRAEATARVTLGMPSALQPASAETPHVFMLTKKPD